MQYLKNTLGILLKSSLPMLYIYRAILRQFPCSSDTIFMLCLSDSLAITMQFSTQYSITVRLLDFILSYFRIGVFHTKVINLIGARFSQNGKALSKYPTSFQIIKMQMYGDDCSSAKEQMFPFMEGY